MHVAGKGNVRYIHRKRQIFPGILEQRLITKEGIWTLNAWQSYNHVGRGSRGRQTVGPPTGRGLAGCPLGIECDQHI